MTLETLLTMFVSLESVSSDKEEMVKQLTFAKLPECLALHIQRTAYESGFPVKRNDQVGVLLVILSRHDIFYIYGVVVGSVPNHLEHG